MPSRLSWPVMGGPTVHPTEVTLASGDPSNSLTARWGWEGNRLLEAAAPGFVLIAGRWRALAGEEGVGGPVGLDNRQQSGLLLHRGSSVEVDDPSDSREGGRMEALRHNPVRRGGRERQLVVEWLQRLERGSGHGGY